MDITKSLPVVVIGATGAIGEAVTTKFLESGYQVIGAARHSPSAISGPHLDSRFSFNAVDVTAEVQARTFFSDIRERHGQLSSLVYTPGLAPDLDVPLATYSLQRWHCTMNTYVSGFLVCFQEALRALAPGGHIVVVSSAVTRFRDGNLPPLFLGHYSAAKAALNELCKWGRREAHERDLFLSRLSPSALETPFHRTAPAFRKPVAMVPLALLVDKIVGAVMSKKETDGELIA